MSLPEWIKKGCGCGCHNEPYSCEQCCDWDKHMEALSIAWEALEGISTRDYNHPSGIVGIVNNAKDAMKRIESLGRDSDTPQGGLGQ